MQGILLMLQQSAFPAFPVHPPRPEQGRGKLKEQGDAKDHDHDAQQPARPMQDGDSLFARVSREALARTILGLLADTSTHGKAIPLVGARGKE